MSELANIAADLIRTHPTLAAEIYRQMSPRPVGGLTAKQSEALQFIRSYHQQRGITPTYDEICEALGLQSKSGVNRLVVALEERGYIDRIPNRARSIVLRQVAA